MTEQRDRIKAIREGLVRNLETIDGEQLASGGLQVLPRMIDNPTPPWVWILPGADTYDETFQRGQDKQVWRVQAIMGSALTETAQIVLDELKAPSGPTSIKEAIEQRDNGRRVTLGGVVDDLRVTGNSGYLPYDGSMFGLPGPLLSCDWYVEIQVRP